ncbi:UNVERIFIED_CONTAM: Retrovirus-related Pol polyprotein from transposon RE1 [Sesamum latifolium]|uniref:Retrovirus-related Pol polyprotein from transposon RE1 n=1 Tax=Sesamum latifolium TaxID=2727402 RepID=A0AAW2Y8S4_9LAMI
MNRRKGVEMVAAYIAIEGDNSVDKSATVAAPGTDLVADLMQALRMIQNNKTPQDPALTTKRILAVGKQIGKLYYLDQHSFSKSECDVSHLACSSSSDQLYTLWHKRLGHSSHSVLSHISALNLSHNNKAHVCPVCPLAKQTRAVFHLSYVQGQKGYKIYDILNRNVLISRDVVFHEHIFPYLSVAPSKVSDSFSIPTPILESPDPTPDKSSRSLDPTTDHTIIPLLKLHFSPLLNPFQHVRRQQNHLSEPNSYMQAKGHLEWESAMMDEIVALEKNNMARLVAKGYNQVEGVDYIGRFSPVAKAITVRTLLAVASSYAWPIHQVDINNAFLHDFLEEDIYMLPPDGYSVPAEKVCKLQRSSYGLKQASRQWNRELTDKLLGYDFLQSSHDHCLFTKNTDAGLLILLVYVDDVLLTGPFISQINAARGFWILNLQ